MRKQDSSRHTGAAAPEATSHRHEREAVRQAPPPARDGIVLVCMTIVAAAIAAMLYAQFALTMPAAAACGGVAWAVFLLMHKNVQKSRQVAHLKAELARSRPKAPRPATAVQTAPAGRDAGPKSKPDAALPEGPNEIPAPAMAAASQTHAATDANPAAVAADAGPPVPFPEPRGRPLDEERLRTGRSTAPKEQAPAAAGSLPEGPVWKGRAVPPGGDGLREQWAFRPRGENATLPGLAGLSGGAHVAPAAATVESDLELVQRKIKALADEVNFGAPLKSAPRKEPEHYAKATAEAIEDSIGALKAAATNMRDQAVGSPPLPGSGRTETFNDPPSGLLGDLVIPASAQTIASSNPLPKFGELPPNRPEPRLPDPSKDFGAAAPSAPAGTKKSPLSRAIDKNAMDMFLSPIVALQANDVGHYDVAMRLRDAAGNAIAVSEAELQSQDSEVAGRLDAARFNRAVQLVQRMEAKSRNGYLMTEITGTALSNRTFLEVFARTYESRPKIAQQLVLTLTQEAIDGASPAAWQSLQDMNSIGFRFALGGLQHVRTDFAKLAATGFAFVRVDADLLVNGLQAGERRVEPEEIFQRAALAGLAVIATGIDTVQAQAALIASGVEFGEGKLFGPPRAITLNGDGGGGRSAAA